MNGVNFFKHTLLIFLLILICVPVIIPFMKSGYFPTHDGEWAVVRLADMFRSLRDFQFPVRYSGALNFGYGYPLFNFAYPFPYYMGILFYFPFSSFVASIKTMFALSVVFSSIFMYLAANTLWRNKISAFVSAVVYVYLPYRMVDLYVRGSIGESISLALFPLIFYLSLKLFESPFARITVVSLSLSIAILITTHNIMSVLFLPLLLGFIHIRIFVEKRWDVLQSFLLSFFLGIGASAFFWFPALYEKSNILLSKIPIADRGVYFVNIDQLIIPSWGYGSPTGEGGFSYQLGISHVLAVLVTLLVLLYTYAKNRFGMRSIEIHAVILTVSYFIYFALMFSFTSFIWEKTPLLKEINYPWTILSQLGFVSSLLLGYLSIKGRYMKYLAIALAAISVFLVYGYARPASYVERGDEFYLTNEATTTSSNELMPLWVKDFPLKHYENKVEVVKGQASISDIEFNSKKITFTYKSEADPTFRINTIFYPGWRAYMNYEEIDIDSSNPQGVIELQASKNRDRIELHFNETLPRMTSDLISVLSILVLLFMLLRPLLTFK